MKTYINNKFKISLILSLAVAFMLSFCMFFFSVSKVSANNSGVSVQQFLPNSDLENVSLYNTTTVFHNESLTAIIEDSYKFTLYRDRQIITINDNMNNLKEMFDVKLFDSNALFFSANARLYSYDLLNQSYSKVSLNNSFEEPVNYFDFNPRYLATTNQSLCKIFAIDNQSFSAISEKGIEIYNGSNVAINQDDQLFLVGSSGIYKTSASLPAIQTTDNTLCSHTPSYLIADNEFVYYIYNSKIYKVSVDGGQPTEFSTLADDAEYQLGNIIEPKRISFNGDNLLVVQSDSIQEFEIKDDKLIFTGFAIAKNKTAYNRTSSTASEIEKIENSFAVLDDYKLMVYQNNNLDNRYARENYKNFSLKDLTVDSVKPTSFALGTSSLLLLYDDITKTTKTVALLDLSQADQGVHLSNPIAIQTNSIIRDICYQSGYYYILSDRGSAPQHIYRAKEGSSQLEFERIDSNISSISFDMMTVDVYQNIYLANKTCVHMLSKQDNYSALTQIIADDSGLNNLSKIQTDLLGNLFLLADELIYQYQNGSLVMYNISKVKSFAFDFVDDDVFILNQNKEFVMCTNQLDNVSIVDLKVPSTFNLKNPQGTFVANGDLKFYTLLEGANAYVVKPNNKDFVVNESFKFDGLSSYSGEYVQICAIDCLGLTTFYALANQNDVVLIEQSQVNEVLDKKITEVPQKVYVATDVNSYYLPIITKDDEYIFNNDGKVRLTKTTVVNPEHKINFLDCDYYYAQFKFDKVTYYGYIPCDFTVEVLTKDFAFDQFKIENVKNATIYSDEDMTQAILTLNEKTQVRVIEQGESISKIAFMTQDGNFEIGYIYSKNIIDAPNIAIRNILIIIAVFACICGTSTYFLMRKRKN